MNIDTIIEGCRKNQQASQQQLFALFYNYAMTVARRYMGSLEQAEEVTSDAFFKTFTKIHLYSGNMPFKPWFRRIVVNCAIDKLRSSMQEMQVADMELIPELKEDHEIETNLTKEQIWKMLDQLPPAYRAVFNLAIVDGYSHEEIAETLNISIGTSKSNLSRARQYLKNLLKNEYRFFE
ncbi:MAG: RNA polymerase sigma factor [Saprospiraceae bacterium]|nr:RNA polymerase sigma factor [Saprospiraceae bacterium]